MGQASGDANRGGRKRIIAVTAAALAALVAVSVVVRLTVFQTEGRAATIAAAVFLYFPLPFIFKSKDIAQYGISWGKGLRGFVETLLLAVLVLTPFYLAFFLIFAAVSFEGIFPHHFIRTLTIQLLLVALPEEFFFRGWLQTELEDIWRRSWKILGTFVGPGWIISAAFFAIFHMGADPRPFRAMVFFPGLLFGWLRARTKSIVFPTILHAVCNITFIVATKIVGL